MKLSAINICLCIVLALTSFCGNAINTQSRKSLRPNEKSSHESEYKKYDNTNELTLWKLIYRDAIKPVKKAGLYASLSSISALSNTTVSLLADRFIPQNVFGNRYTEKLFYYQDWRNSIVYGQCDQQGNGSPSETKTTEYAHMPYSHTIALSSVLTGLTNVAIHKLPFIKSDTDTKKNAYKHFIEGAAWTLAYKYHNRWYNQDKHNSSLRTFGVAFLASKLAKISAEYAL